MAKMRDIGANLAGRIGPDVARRAERALLRVPAVQRRLQKQYDAMLAEMRPAIRPYTGTVAA
jgi:hypothetical protein